MSDIARHRRSPVVFRRRLAKEDGVALIIALGVMGVLMIIGLAVATYVMATGQLVLRQKRSTMAIHTADAGVNEGIWVLQRTNNDPTTLLGGGVYDLTKTTSSGLTYHVSFSRPYATTMPYRWVITSDGYSKTMALKRRVQAEVDSYNVWDINFSGLSTNAGGAVTGNVSIHGTFYVRGHFELSGSTQFRRGPLYVKTEQSIPGASGGANSISGDLKLQGSAQVGDPTGSTDIDGASVGPIDVYLDDEAIGTTPTNFYYNTLTYGPNILDIQLPPLDSSVMQGYYYSADLNLDDASRLGNGVMDGSMPGYPLASFTIGTSRPSFSYGPYNYVDSTGISHSGGYFTWDTTNAVLRVDGTVFVDGPLTLGSSSEDIVYTGKGTIVTNGDITLNTQLHPADNTPTDGVDDWAQIDANFPETYALGLVTMGTIAMDTQNDAGHRGMSGGVLRMHIMAAFYGKQQISVSKQVNFKGSMVSGMLDFMNVPDLFTSPELSSNLPPSLPGSGSNTRIMQVVGWREAAP